MEKGTIVFAIILVFGFLVLVQAGYFDVLIGKITGKFISGMPAEEEKCMKDCIFIGCESNDTKCAEGNKDRCMGQCRKPLSEGEKCAEICIKKFCPEDEKYFSCMEENKEKCDDECGLKGDAPDLASMGKEQRCITECVSKVDKMLRCKPGEGGEKGNEVCQKCSEDCKHLYEGPCLSDEKKKEKEKACKTCEHCYGKPVMGDSGEGYQCMVDIECADASSEFGDESGEGPGIVSKIGDFIKGLFGGD